MTRYWIARMQLVIGSRSVDYHDPVEVVLASEASQRLAELEGQADLWRDEFKRIQQLGNTEIAGICYRAIQDIERLVPITKERDALQAKVAALEQELAHWREAAASVGETDGHGLAVSIKAQRERAEAAERDLRVITDNRDGVLLNCIAQRHRAQEAEKRAERLEQELAKLKETS